jgi:hypothetical protein
MTNPVSMMKYFCPFQHMLVKGNFFVGMGKSSLTKVSVGNIDAPLAKLTGSILRSFPG